MKYIGKIFLAILFVFISVFPFGCINPNKIDVIDLYAFGTPVHIEVYDGKFSSGVKEEISSILTNLENEFSLSNENSSVKKLNDTGTAEISLAFTDIFNLSKECYTLSDGKFDPTVYPLVNIWGFSNDYPRLDFVPPTETEINGILSSNCIGIDNISVQNGFATKSNANTEIDFGGIIKGFALDKIATVLKNDGHKKGYVSLGSSSIYILSVETLYVNHPRKIGNILSINLKKKSDQSISTSGDYERCYTYDGKTYSHIIDVNTGYPTETNIASVTLIGNNGALLDGLSTALVLCSYNPQDTNNELTQKLKSLTKNGYITNFFAIYDDGEFKHIITNEKQGKDFTLLDETYQIINI